MGIGDRPSEGRRAEKKDVREGGARLLDGLMLFPLPVILFFSRPSLRVMFLEVLNTRIKKLRKCLFLSLHYFECSWSQYLLIVLVLVASSI